MIQNIEKYEKESVLELHILIESLIDSLSVISKGKKYNLIKEKYNALIEIYNKKVKFQAYTTIK